MKKSLVFLSLVLLLVACGRSRPPQPIPTPDASPRVLGQVDVTFQVDPASGELSTSASHLAAQATTNAFSFAPLSKGLTDKDGVRYLYGTFKVGNTSNTKMNNLSFYALSTSQSIAGTAISELRDARNQAVTDPALARSILPTHRMSDNSGRLVVKADEADFQGFSAAQVQGVQSELSFGTLLEYGYSVHNSAGGQALNANEEGVVSFAIKFPYNPSQSASFPFSFTLSFAAVANGPSQVTRSAEEGGSDEVCSRANKAGASRVVILGATADPTCTVSTLRLNDVKIAQASGTLEAKYLLGRGPGEPQPQADVKVNFGLKDAPLPSGFIEDYGQAYGVQPKGTYGWLKLSTRTPVDASGAARDRNRSGVPQELDTLMHLQRGDCCAKAGGFVDEVYWEYALPNGMYEVTVYAGDVASSTDGYDSQHTLNVEGVPALSRFQADAKNEYGRGTVTVEVKDGKLTIDPVGGFNTKINYVEIASTSAGATQQPFVTGVDPEDGATDVSPNTSTVTAGLRLPNGGVDAATLPGNVTLTRLSDNTPVSGTPDTSGGADTISFKSAALLDANTSYRFEVTSGVKDVKGNPFKPFSSTFTTGTLNTNTGPVAFNQITVDTGQKFTSVTIGPDGRLYASTAFGLIYRYKIESDGSLTQEKVISTVRSANGNTDRTVIGLAFDPSATASNLTLWISDNPTYKGPYVDDWTGKIARLTGADLDKYQAVVVGLPRSVRDHETNSVAFGPDGALYVNQGSNNAMGAPDAAWGDRPERVLSAAVLRLELGKLPANLPLNVKTEEGGAYNPFVDSAPLTVYASGVRNAYDLVWHSNGRLYVPTNGSAPGGNAPATPDTLPAACQNRIDADRFGAFTQTGIPGITNNSERETDYLFRVSEGRYYGHPNPARCEWVLNAGNVSSAKTVFEMDDYPLGTRPDRNYDADGVFDAGSSASANGVIEYKSDTFGGALKGKLLNVRYSKERDIQTFSLDASGSVSERVTGTASNIAGFTGFNGPLDIIEDVRNGNLYVADFGPQSLDVAGRIVLLTPKN